MAGGVYCPLSPSDPENHLDLIIQQTQNLVVLVHYPTKNKFKNYIISIDINSIVINSNLERDAHIEQLSNAIVTAESIAYIICTSGSSRTTKAVRYFDL